MKTNRLILAVLIGCVIIFLPSCERGFSEDVEFATLPKNPDVFIDGFSSGLQYLPFAGSKFDAFSVDRQTKYSGTSSMRFDVPNVGDPTGAYAGAIFPDYGGRNLSGYDALTFWAKASQGATINEIGFGNDFGENKFLVSLKNMRISTNWVKYTIALPDPSRLTGEKGLFWYAEGPENGNGYSIWFDEIKYEKTGTVAHPRPAIQNGENQLTTGFIGTNVPLSGLTQTFNLGNGQDQTVNVAPSYFTFSSSNTDVARVNQNGVVSIIGTGTAVITAELAGVKAKGSLTIASQGAFVPAPTPSRNPANVISVFSNSYTNVPVDFYNGYFAPFQTTLGGADITINGDNIIQYTNLNFVATQFTNPTVNASQMTHLHVDIQIKEPVDPNDFISVELVDFGPDATFAGGDDKSGRVRFASTSLSSNKWISLDIPLSSFVGLTNRNNLAQLFFISDATISTILVDNMYFFKQ
jgi:hypothetical protein